MGTGVLSTISFITISACSAFFRVEECSPLTWIRSANTALPRA